MDAAVHPGQEWTGWSTAAAVLVAATVTSESQLFHHFPGGKADLVRAVAAWRHLLADGVRRMQAAALIEAAADPDRPAAAVLATIQGGLVLSQPERSSWPLRAALDQVLAGLHARTPPAPAPPPAPPPRPEEPHP